MNRRSFITASAGFAALALSPEATYATAANSAAWTLGVADLEADVARTPMELVHGKAPAGLSGALYRNGPGKFHRPGGDATHWFDGDGLMRAFRIRDGQATIEARFADTPKRRRDIAAGAVITPGFGTKAGAGAAVGGPDDVNPANISVLPVGGELWALWEQGSPLRIDRDTLQSEGFKTLRPDLAGMPFLAHPRAQPDGRVWNLGVAPGKAFIWNIAPDGTLGASTLIDLPRASYIHDFTATDRHLVIVLQPWVQDHFALPYVTSLDWKPDLGTQVLVVDKADFIKRRVFELPSFFTFHMGDAWAEQDGTIRFDICIDADPTFAAKGGSEILKGVYTAKGKGPQLAMITLRPNGKAELTRTATGAEFPKGDARAAGSARRYTAHTSSPRPGEPLFSGLAVQDWKTGATRGFDFGRDHLLEEAVFVPRPGSSQEFDGWLVGPSVNLKAHATELHVLDAKRVDVGPLCTWRAKQALPISFHGAFVEA